jgi:GrpB-like predicted nucleotidyltransferase (UPF0157 family)
MGQTPDRVIGLDRGVVRIAPYTPEWRRLFESEKARIEAAIGTWVLDIQHVGSTSIPGMPAKPILDIAIAVRDFEEARACIAPLEQLGYEYRGENGIPRRHYFHKGTPASRTHHVHMLEIHSRQWEDQILFRDYLIRHPETAQEYAVLKQELAEQFPADRQAYLDGKTPLVERVLCLAKKEQKA